MKTERIRRTAWVVCLLAGLACLTLGCKSSSGSREYIPGKGWRSTQNPPPTPGPTG